MANLGPLLPGGNGVSSTKIRKLGASLNKPINKLIKSTPRYSLVKYSRSEGVDEEIVRIYADGRVCRISESAKSISEELKTLNGQEWMKAQKRIATIIGIC
jgi:hypothetical protein